MLKESSPTVRFLSSNGNKIREVQDILAPKGVKAIPVAQKIEEIQTDNVESLIRDKAIKAFEIIGRPLFVEHTGLYADALNDLPGGLTQVFWDKLEADKMSEIFKLLRNQSVTAKTHIGLIDGKTIRMFVGEIGGSFSDEPRGDRTFQWDCVFVPEGYSTTFAEMGSEKKNKISMRRIALDRLAEGLLHDK